MQRNRNSERGYSLAEVMVAVAVFTTIIIAALLIYDRSNRIFKRGVENSNMQQNTRVAFDSVVAELRRAGYDFDRDGIPTGNTGGTNAYQQPDEQFEYIGPAAITIRGNFDFETETSPCGGSVTDNCDNGRERTLETDQFPVVTTGNDEIITYALVPDSQTSIPTCNPTTNCVQFYADVQTPRRAYPGGGGTSESLVQIPGVDLCPTGCNNPPYTLYRFTLARNQNNFTNGANVVRTPLASNIRSLNFTYFEDANGQTTLKDIAGTTDISTGATVRGEGQYDVANPSALVTGRTIRTKVYSVRAILTGMSEAGEANFIQTGETIASVKNKRQFRLETIVSPRNAQKRGMREQDTMAPGKPTNITVTTGRCGIVYLDWDSPVVNAAFGAPDQYKVMYDLASNPGFNEESTTFTNTFGYVWGLTPNLTYKFRVVALNSYGSRTSDEEVTATPLNVTRPQAPSVLTATSGLNGRVTLTWNRPTADAAGSTTPASIPPVEIRGYRVERTTDTTGTSGWEQVSPSPNGVTSYSDVVTWDDTTALNCTTYLYRVRAEETCMTQANYNSPADVTYGYSAWSGTAQGRAESTIAPKAPTDLRAEAMTCNSGICDVKLSWPPVLADTANNPITTNYTIWRRNYGSATWTAQATNIPGTPSTPTGEFREWTQSNVHIGGGERYEYKVTATQCSLDSADSPIRIFPCNFPAATVSTPALTAPGAFDGSGTSVDPWSFAGDATVGVGILNQANIQKVVGRLYVGETLIFTQELTPPQASYGFGFEAEPFTLYRLDVNIISSDGCIQYATAWVTGQAQACCLTPRSVDNTIGSHSAGNSYSLLTLKNVCQTLTLKQFSITFDQNINSVNERITSVVFPARSGGATCPEGITSATGCTTYTFGGSGVRPTAAYNALDATPSALSHGRPALVEQGTPYRVRVNYSRVFTSFSITSATFTYRETSDLADEACPVVP